MDIAIRMRLFIGGLCVLGLLLVSGCGRDDPTGRVIVLGIDGLDPEAVDLLMSEGKMPNLAKMRQEGAYGRLISQKPLLSPIIWTTIATGRSPGDHGIGHFVAMDPQTGTKLPVTSDMRRVQALWNLAAQAGKRPAVVGWWATWPPEPIDGVMVSDHTAYHFLFEEGFTGGLEDENKIHPPELVESIQSQLHRPTDMTQEELSGFVTVSDEELDRPFDLADDLSHFRWALATAMSYRDIGLGLWESEEPGLMMTYIEGVDSTSHLFGHLFRTPGLAGDLAAQQSRFGNAVEGMYGFADALIGEYLSVIDDDTTLVVLSDHGFRLGELHDDPSQAGDMRRVSERFHRQEGVLYLYGNGVRKHSRIDQPGILDVAPTVLHLLGLPASREMPGRVLTEALAGEAELERLATYESSGSSDRVSGTRDEAVDQAVLERLESLGYLGGRRSAESDRNLAAIAFEDGRYDEAVVMYQRLLEESPEDSGLETSLAGVLGALGRYDEALIHLDDALAGDPLNIEAYHNRAVLHERRGDPAQAVADYRSALRYNPGYEPSRAALLRLTGSAVVQRPKNETEAQATALAEQAADEARRGNYERAVALLDQAVAIAPDYTLVYQYRSNVAYLMGDQAGAIAALEKALALEPDNALFRQNLAKMQSLGTNP